MESYMLGGWMHARKMSACMVDMCMLGRLVHA